MNLSDAAEEVQEPYGRRRLTAIMDKTIAFFENMGKTRAAR